MLVYFSIYVRAHPNRMFELLSYINTVRHAAARYTWPHARDYDHRFRQRQAVEPTRSWAIIDSHLFLFYMPAPVVNNNQSRNKPNYNSNYHRGNIGNSNKPFPAQRRRGFCWAFNDGKCQNTACKLKHSCENCGDAQHGKSTCPKK